MPSPAQLVTIKNGAAGTVNVFEVDQSAGTGGGGGGTDPGGMVALAPGARIGMEAVNFPGYRVRHRNNVARLDPIGTGSSLLDRQDSTFTVRTGLGLSTGWSFESVNYPGRFLIVENGNIVLRSNTGRSSFRRAATFLSGTGLTGQGTSFRSYTNTSLYLRHINYVLYARTNDGSALFGADATFNVRAGLG